MYLYPLPSIEETSLLMNEQHKQGLVLCCGQKLTVGADQLFYNCSMGKWTRSRIVLRILCAFCTLGVRRVEGCKNRSSGMIWGAVIPSASL